MALAAKTNTTLHSWPERQVVFDEDGARVPDEEVGEIAEGFWGIVSDAFKYSRENSKDIPAAKSLLDYVKEKADGIVQGLAEEEGRTRKRRIIREAEMWGAFVGSAVQTQSLRFFWLEECVEGENPFVAR
jgi:hypothetical protein